MDMALVRGCGAGLVKVFSLVSAGRSRALR